MIEAVIRGTHELQAEFAAIDRSVNRATMYAVREAGRRVKREARKAAPVYTGADAVNRRQHKASPTETGNRPVSGLYRASIANGRRLKRDGPGSYGIGVAPRGPRVHLYSRKVEDRHQPMQRGYDAVHDDMPAIAEQAWGRATRKGHR